jgi:hypothetical protein
MSAKKSKSSPKALPNRKHNQSQPARPRDGAAIPLPGFQPSAQETERLQAFAEAFDKEAMADRQFWVDRGAEFERLAHKYPNIDGVYGNLDSSLWWFRGLLPGAEDDLKIAARNAARGLHGRDASKTWCQWLNFVRDSTLNRDWGFELMEYTMPQTRKGPSALRLERFRAPLWDTAENKPKRTLTDFERAQLWEFERATLQEQENAYQEAWDNHKGGIIKSFFESSARLCEELASLSFESEAAANALLEPSFLNRIGGGTLPENAYEQLLAIERELLALDAAEADKLNRFGVRLGGSGLHVHRWLPGWSPEESWEHTATSATNPHEDTSRFDVLIIRAAGTAALAGDGTLRARFLNGVRAYLLDTRSKDFIQGNDD